MTSIRPIFMAALLLSGCALSNTSSPAEPAHIGAAQTVASPPRVIDNLELSQTISFREDLFEVCFSLKNLGAQGLILRAPLSYAPGGQLQIVWRDREDRLPTPRGDAPDTDNFLSYDILPPNATLTVCASEARANLPDETISLTSLFQPWSRVGTSLPVQLALRGDLRLPDFENGAAKTAPCTLSTKDEQITCKPGANLEQISSFR